MRFYKICAHGHPTSKLPSVLWDARASRATFEFLKTGTKGVLACDVDDPELQALLTEAGYLTEHGQTGNIPGMALMHSYPEKGSPAHEEIKTAEARARRK